MLADDREEIRRREVLRIMKARREPNPDLHPKQFIPPEVILDSQNYLDLIAWDVVPCTEPPLTINMDLAAHRLLKGWL